MIRISNLKLPIGYNNDVLKKRAERLLHHNSLTEVKIVRRSLDSRKKDNIHYVITLDVTTGDDKRDRNIVSGLNKKDIVIAEPKKYSFPYSIKDKELTHRPVIVGTGPAGYFAAYMLAKAGAKPIVLERGYDVDRRKNDVETFWNGGPLDPESNVSFGEGGAGTFSDGKLFTGNKDKTGVIHEVMNIFHEMGADENITYDAKPHIGTDVLHDVMKNLRKCIESEGAEVRFGCRLDDIEVSENASDAGKTLYKLTINDSNKNEKPAATEFIYTDALILAVGHSSRDTFHMLKQRGFSMERKPFAMGLRIEHRREDIDNAQYGTGHDERLPAADYKMTYHSKNGRNVFSFCMCPGGYVVNASSVPGCMTVNGMSYSKRDSDNSNSAIVVNVMPEDFGEGDELKGLEFQQNLEETFYKAGDGLIPVQRFGDFKAGIPTTSFGTVTPVMKGKYTYADLKRCLPQYIVNAIIEGVDFFGSIIPCFNSDDSLLSGIESRTSSPVRIIRENTLMAPEFPGIFPCGEGAGYAGGITSAAADGIRCAEALMQYLLELENYELQR